MPLSTWHFQHSFALMNQPHGPNPIQPAACAQTTYLVDRATNANEQQYAIVAPIKHGRSTTASAVRVSRIPKPCCCSTYRSDRLRFFWPPRRGQTVERTKDRQREDTDSTEKKHRGVTTSNAADCHPESTCLEYRAATPKHHQHGEFLHIALLASLYLRIHGGATV